jgi:23S rRNA pseudouridine1911/1915/1917 synthase
MKLKVEHTGKRLDAFLAEHMKTFSRVFLKGLIEAGHVTVDGKPGDASRKVVEGQLVEVTMPEQAAGPGADEFESWVLFEDRRLLVLNKPSGLLMHPLGESWLTAPEAARAEPEANLAALLQVHRPAILKAGTPRCGIVHRLDKPTSGVLAVAKDPETWEAMTEGFKDRVMEKAYRAIVKGVPSPTARVKAPVGRNPGHRRVVVTPLGKEAETAFKVVAKGKRAALVEATPLTGRTHQIRAHLAYLGHPVAGDLEFPGLKAPRLMLHAYRLAFTHPLTGKDAEFTADPPADFAAFWKSLKAKS